MNTLDVDGYLARIGYRGSCEATLGTLRALHRAHLHAVPFENLDVHLGRPIHLDRTAFFHKIVGERRGGFCYEQNGLFADVLAFLGFGFGRSFCHHPLSLDAPQEEEAEGIVYRAVDAGGQWRVESRRPGGEPRLEYVFTFAPQRLEMFAAMCAHHQTSPASPFTQDVVCSMPTARGRITIRGHTLIVTEGDTRHETRLDDEARQAILEERFGIRLPAALRR